MLSALFILAQLQSGASWFEATRNADDLTVERTRAAVREFVWEWRFGWDASQSMMSGVLGPMFSEIRHFRVESLLSDRNTLIHCHPDSSSGYRRMEPFIIDGVGKHAICPSWSLNTGLGALPWDERLGIDRPLSPRLLSGIRTARDSLLELLDAAARAHPRDEWIAGQRVRFALDQGDTTRALGAATASCTAAQWWCMLLESHVRHGRGEVLTVDTLLDRAIAAMPEPVRCKWNDLSLLVDTTSRRAYSRRSCAARDSASRIAWWLSDPLYMEPGNPRRAEHFARKVTIALREDESVPERWDWRVEFGGGALREMLVRYGWPAYSLWGGFNTNRSHYGYLGSGDSARFATAEYPHSRYHTVPRWEAVDDPWGARPTDWDVWQPTGPGTLWWPREHAPYPTPLAQLDQQIGLFRRESNALLAIATSYAAENLGWAATDSSEIHLFYGNGPESMRHLIMVQPLFPTTIVRTLIPSQPALVSLEVAAPGQQGAAVARTRFGVRPPRPLAEMQIGDIDISSAVILRPMAPGATPPSDAGLALSAMAGSTSLPAGVRIGVYWETYGLTPGDSANLTVSLTRQRERGLLDRLASVIGRGGPADEGVTIRWFEPNDGLTIATIPGRIPIQGRQITLDLSAVEPGPWTLSVSAARPGGVTVTRATEIVIVP